MLLIVDQRKGPARDRAWFVGLSSPTKLREEFLDNVAYAGLKAITTCITKPMSVTVICARMSFDYRPQYPAGLIRTADSSTALVLLCHLAKKSG